MQDAPRRGDGRWPDARSWSSRIARLRAEAIRIFDRTFAITYALEAVAIIVAVMGIAGALLALVIDRRREFGLFRFLGASTGQVRRSSLSKRDCSACSPTSRASRSDSVSRCC